ncbi:hypothetical protein SDC9_108028 [bioreactor metagenome]|uniref:Uncharacterized protein n=1 Tax=bioreactor metagenome TaxID=1076179 RepID=A0A645B6Y6_9ZZZZ
MSGKTFFCNIVHSPASDLYLDPFPVGTHYRQVKGLIAIGLGMAYPVTNTIRTELINIRNGGIDVPALLFFIHPGIYLKDDPNGKEVINFVEINTFSLHFLPDGVKRFYAGAHLIFDVHLIKRFNHRFGKTLINFIPLLSRLFNFSRKFSVRLRVFVLETKFFEFGFYGKKTQSMRQRRINVHGFTGYLELLGRSHGRQCPHIVQTIGNFYQDHTNIFRHRQQEFTKIFRLCRYIFTKHTV